MRFERLDLNLLVAFDAIITERSVTRAAEKLHLSQSAMSSTLGRLRDFFGDDLVIRVGREQRLTPLADELIGPVRKVLKEIQGTIIRRQPFDPETSTQTFSLASSDYMTQVVVSDLAQQLAEIAPNVRLNIVPLRGESTRISFLRGEIDFLLCPQSIMLPDLPYERLFSEDFAVIGCASYWKRRDVLTKEDFETTGHVVIRLGAQQAYGLDELICMDAGVHRRAEITVGAFDHVAPFVVGTGRLAVLQRGMAELVSSQMALRVFEVPFENQIFTEMLQWQPINANSSAHVWFREVATERIRQVFDNVE